MSGRSGDEAAHLDLNGRQALIKAPEVVLGHRGRVRLESGGRESRIKT